MTAPAATLPARSIQDLGTASLVLGLLALNLAALGPLIASLVISVEQDYSVPGWYNWLPPAAVFSACVICALLARRFGMATLKEFRAAYDNGLVAVHHRTGFPVSSGKSSSGVILGLISLFAFVLTMLIYILAWAL